MPNNTSRCRMRNIYGGKRCRSNICHHLNAFHRPLCYTHFIYTFGKAASIIQNLYRSNKKRRAINIYIKLPQDLQNKILFIMQENDLIKKHHHDVIENILIKRFNNSRIKRAEILFNLATTTELASGIINNANKISIENYLDDLYQFLKLVIKYKDVISYELHDEISTELASIEKYILYDILLELEDLHEFYVNTIGKLTIIFGLLIEHMFYIKI